MEAKIRLCVNMAAITAAEATDRKPPKAKYIYSPFVFDTADLKMAYIDEEGHITLKHGSEAEWLTIEYTDEIWQEIKKRLSPQEIRGLKQCGRS